MSRTVRLGALVAALAGLMLFAGAGLASAQEEEPQRLEMTTPEDEEQVYKTDVIEPDPEERPYTTQVQDEGGEPVRLDSEAGGGDERLEVTNQPVSARAADDDAFPLGATIGAGIALLIAAGGLLGRKRFARAGTTG